MKARRLSRVAGLAVFLVLLSASVGMVQAALHWQLETVDSDGDVGEGISMALDADDHPHISYFDSSNEDLKYASYDGDAWEIETVDSTGDAGRYTSLALDSDDQPHISYLDVINGDLKYASFDGTSWQIETVDAEGIVGGFNSLELDGAGNPHISYFDATNGDLKYTVFDGTSWQIETVDATDDVGDFTSLELDGAGNPHISYYDDTNDDLKYAAFDGSSWQIETIDSDGIVGWTNSLALDGDDHPHISYFDFSSSSLNYAHFDGTAWQIEIVDDDDVGLDTSLALDEDGHPHISYRAGVQQDLKYATFDGTSWQIETVDSDGLTGFFSSLALDSTGQPHISYQEVGDGTLEYAHLMLNEPPTVDAGGPYSGIEGSPITIGGAVSDSENDDLATLWTYTIDSADPGTTCSFGDDSQVDTTFTCTDDGTFTLSLSANDGLNPAVIDTATVTISNANPDITDVAANLSGNQVTITVEASDPGLNDTLNYAFDCDNDGTYEIDAGATPSTTCPLNPQQEGTFTFGVQVSDDDGGISTDTASVTIATELCASDYTGVLRYSDSCRDYETAITIPDPNGPVTVCASTHNGLLRSPSNGACAGHEVSYELPEDGPLNVCVSTYTQMMRAVPLVSQCAGHEFGRVIAATEVGETGPSR